MFKIIPGNILIAFGGLVLGLGLAHTYLNFSLTRLVYQSRDEKMLPLRTYQANLWIIGACIIIYGTDVHHHRWTSISKPSISIF